MSSHLSYIPRKHRDYIRLKNRVDIFLTFHAYDDEVLVGE